MGQTHIRALASSTEVKVTAVAEPVEALAERLRAMGLPVYATARDLLESGLVDGVIIAAPTGQHLALTEQILAAGTAVLCEKPCGLSPEQARAAAVAAERYGVPLQVAYWRRFIPGLKVARERIAAGELGAVHFTVCQQWDEAPPPAQFRTHSGGIFIDMGVHEIDQLRWLTGAEVEDVAVSAFPTVADPLATGDIDSAQALVTMSDGSAAVISLGRYHPGGDLVFAEVFGTRDHIRIPVLEPEDGEVPQLEALRLQAEAFARYAKGGPQEGATAADAEAVLTIAARLTAAGGLTVLGAP